MLAASGALALMLATVFAVSLVAIHDLRSADAHARHARDVVFAAMNVESGLGGLQRGERGYVITGDQTFLAPWSKARTELPTATAALARLVAHDPGEASAGRAIVAAVGAYIRNESVPLIAIASGDLARARSVVATRVAERRLDGIRARLDRVSTTESAMLTVRRAHARGAANRAEVVGIVGVVATLLLIMVFVFYVDRWVRQNAELTEAVRSAREAEQAKDEFFALVSHELRTPLTAIIGYAELMLDDASEPLRGEQRRFVEIVERNAERLLRLVGDLLFAAQVDSGTARISSGAVDLRRLVHETVEAARPRADERRIELRAELDPIGPCTGDGDRLSQVLDNLVSNALKFTPEHGRVVVRLSASGDDEARLEVRDTGIGIPESERKRLFERFFRASTATERAIPGVGLGLTIVEAIVTAHGGRVEIQSTEDSGTTVTVLLPLQPSAGAERSERQLATGGR
jgi:signal transduction histidine kinase